MKLLWIICCWINMGVAILTDREPFTPEEEMKVSASIQKAMENEYDSEVIETLKLGAAKKDSDCLLYYGEYLLHKEVPDLEIAFECLDQASERGNVEAQSLIHSVIDIVEVLPDRRKALFVHKWPIIYTGNMLIINPPRYTVQAIAHYFLDKDCGEEERDLTPLKLQKMLFYAQSCSRQALKKPLFKEAIEAWQYGPVVRDIYHANKTHGARLIPKTSRLRKHTPFDQETSATLEAVYAVCKDYSPGKLTDETHLPESSWSKVYDRGQNNEIPFLYMQQEKGAVLEEILEMRMEIISAHREKRKKTE